MEDAYVQGPPPVDDPGWKATKHEARDYAWDKATKKKDGETVFKMDTYVKGTNPITGYRVVLTPTG